MRSSTKSARAGWGGYGLGDQNTAWSTMDLFRSLWRLCLRCPRGQRRGRRLADLSQMSWIYD